MYEVKWKDTAGNACAEKFDNLDSAMDHSKTLGIFVCITGNNYEIVGIFGANSIVDGRLPNGNEYTWRKRRI